MLAVVLATFLTLSGGMAGAQEPVKFDPADLWFRAYQLLQEGIKHEESGKELDALAKYGQSKPLFDDLARSFPEFHPELVEYRRTQLVQKIGALRDRMRNRGQQPAPSGNFADNAAPPVQDPGLPPSVQPVSPEFAPSNGGGDGVLQLPEWSDNNVAPLQGSGIAGAPPIVVRPPTDPSTVSPYPPMPVPNFAPQNPNAVAGATDNPFLRLQQDFDRMRAQMDQLAQKNRLLENDIAQKRSELYDSQTQLAQSQQRTADLQRRLKEAESKAGTNPDINAEVAQLKQILTEALGELEKANQEKKELVAQLNSTQSELERIRRDRDDIEKERNSLAAIMEGGGESTAVAQLMEENRDLREKLKEVEKSARLLEKDNGDKTVQIALLKEQVEQIKVERQKLIDDNHRYEGHIADLRNRLKELGQELSDEDMTQVASLSPEVAAENELLRAVVLKQLRRQSQVMQTKSLLLRELEKLGSEAENLFAMVEDMASGPALNEEERKMFKAPEMAELVEAAGVERVEGIILVEGKESDGSGTGIVETQNLDDELVQIQKAARLDYSEGRYEEAEEAYRKYLAFRPKSVVCLCNLALVKMATREHEEAQELLEKAIAIDSGNGLAYYLLGRNYYAQGKYDEALERLTESIHYDPKNARAHNCVGVISSQKGYVNRAEGAFNEAVKIDPEFGDAHYNLAVLYATMDKPDANRAEQHYQKAIDLGVPRDNSIEHYLEAARLPGATVSLR
ncbi:MAG: tetratricopeptide repeat protein [Verrucomicrobiae bacterium]|nr:tetratricopeptide repeat protein [Verrucomicrobiae bacterium]